MGFPHRDTPSACNRAEAAGDLLSYKYSKQMRHNPLRNKLIEALCANNRTTTSQRPWSPRFHGSFDRWRGPGVGLPALKDRDRKRGHPGPVRHGPAVTGLSLPRGKATHRTAQRGAINVRPSRCGVVMADKRLSGSSHSQSSPDTCAALRYVQSEGKTPTADAEPRR